MIDRTSDLGRCRLCLTDGTLRYSHVISNFLYELQWNAKHQTKRLTSDPEDYSSTTQQQGEREYLLCNLCEIKISGWETYAAGVIRQLYKRHPFPQGIFLRDIDYKLFKLFTMSLLWRMSIASLPMFVGVALASKEERLRKMLFEADPGHDSDYLCVMRRLIQGKGFYNPDLFFLNPLGLTNGYLTEFELVIHGLEFHYILADQPRLLRQYKSSISEKGTLWVDVHEDDVFDKKVHLRAGAAIINNPRAKKDFERTKNSS